MGSEIHTISYHPRDLYIMATGQPEEYTLPDDTYHYEWSREGMYLQHRNEARADFYQDITFKPHVEQGIIKVVDAKTWSVIDT